MSVAPGNVMPPEAGGAMPPQAAPPQGATPEQAAAAGQQEQMAQIEAIAASAPQPEKPYSAAMVKKVVKALNALIDKVDKKMADVEFEPEGSKIEGPLPPDVFVPIVLVLTFVQQLPGMEKYQMDPGELVSDAALRKLQGLLKMMAKDKDLIKAMKGEAPEAPAEEEAPPPPEDMPGEMTEDDEAIAEMM